MGGRHLDHPGPERLVHVLVGDDGKLAADERQDRVFANQMSVTLVPRVDRNSGIAQHRLRPRRRDDGELLCPFNRVPDVPEVAVRFGVVYLVVAQSRLVERAPIDDILAAIDQPLVEHPDEHFPHRLGEPLVHREPFTLPVARRSELPQLPDDRSPVLFSPLPDPLDELLPSQVVALEPLLRESFLDGVLRRNTGVIGARDPARFIPLHSLPPNEDVLDRIVEDVTHRQDTRDIRRGDDDGVGCLPFSNRPVKEAVGLPVLVPLVLDLLRVVGFRQLWHHRRGERLENSSLNKRKFALEINDAPAGCGSRVTVAEK